MEAYSQDELADALMEAAHATYEEREATLTPEVVRAWERRVLLVTLSGLWIHHVDAMDELREAAMLQAFGQQDPLVAYKRQGFDMFQQFQGVFRQERGASDLSPAIPTDRRAHPARGRRSCRPSRLRRTETALTPRTVMRRRKTAQAAAAHSKRAKTPAKVSTGR